MQKNNITVYKYITDTESYDPEDQNESEEQIGQTFYEPFDLDNIFDMIKQERISDKKKYKYDDVSIAYGIYLVVFHKGHLFTSATGDLYWVIRNDQYYSDKDIYRNRYDKMSSHLEFKKLLENRISQN